MCWLPGITIRGYIRRKAGTLFEFINKGQNYWALIGWERGHFLLIKCIFINQESAWLPVNDWLIRCKQPFVILKFVIKFLLQQWLVACQISTLRVKISSSNFQHDNYIHCSSGRSKKIPVGWSDLQDFGLWERVFARATAKKKLAAITKFDFSRFLHFVVKVRVQDFQSHPPEGFSSQNTELLIFPELESPSFGQVLTSTFEFAIPVYSTRVQAFFTATLLPFSSLRDHFGRRFSRNLFFYSSSWIVAKNFGSNRTRNIFSKRKSTLGFAVSCPR